MVRLTKKGKKKNALLKAKLSTVFIHKSNETKSVCKGKIIIKNAQISKQISQLVEGGKCQRQGSLSALCCKRTQTKWLSTSEDADDIYTQGNGEQVEAISATKTNQTRWAHAREEQVDRHAREQNFKVKQEVTEDNKRNWADKPDLTPEFRTWWAHGKNDLMSWWSWVWSLKGPVCKMLKGAWRQRVDFF